MGIISGLGIISESKRKYHTEAKREGRVEQKHGLEERGTVYASAVLERKIKAGGIEIKRYIEKVNSSIRNNFFELTMNCF